MSTVNITRQNDKILLVDVPYNIEFINRAKDLSGSWRPEKKVWAFDVRDEMRVRELCLEVFGHNGHDDVEFVDVRILASEFLSDEHTIEAFGRTLARRKERDSYPRLGDGVVVVEGRFEDRGGSRANPRIEKGETEGVVLEVRDVPRPAFEQARDEVNAKIERLIQNSSPSSATWRTQRIEALRSAVGRVNNEPKPSKPQHIKTHTIEDEEFKNILRIVEEECGFSAMMYVRTLDHNVELLQHLLSQARRQRDEARAAEGLAKQETAKQPHRFGSCPPPTKARIGELQLEAKVTKGGGLGVVDIELDFMPGRMSAEGGYIEGNASMSIHADDELENIEQTIAMLQHFAAELRREKIKDTDKYAGKPEYDQSRWEPK